MLRIVVLSDSHGDIASLKMAVKNEPDAKHVIFLGDGIHDVEAAEDVLADTIVCAVKGNCDYHFSSEYPKKLTPEIGGKNFYITHGDAEHVKYGLDTLKLNAYMCKSDIVLFGHTHAPFILYDGLTHFFNPGSVRENSYGVIDITDNGVMCFHKKIIR